MVGLLTAAASPEFLIHYYLQGFCSARAYAVYTFERVGDRSSTKKSLLLIPIRSSVFVPALETTNRGSEVACRIFSDMFLLWQRSILVQNDYSIRNTRDLLEDDPRFGTSPRTGLKSDLEERTCDNHEASAEGSNTD